MKIISCVLFMLTCLSQISVIAQNTITLSGKITDQHGTPLSLVTIAVENTTSGTYTDDNGRYSLKVSPGYSAGQSTQLHITRKCCYFELR